jgi:simple sugar transport system ATP-binding protein
MTEARVGPEGEGCPVLRLRAVTKAYPGVLANHDVDLDVYAGETHVLLGENGAGKSTLMNIAYGLVTPDAGSLEIDGVVTDLGSPKDAIRHGIAYVQQQFSLVPILTVAENIALMLHSVGRPLPVRQAAERVRRLVETYGLDVTPHTRAEALSVLEQQRVELLKALAVGPKVLLLDEPTSVLTPQEAAQLADLIRRLNAEGIAVVLITHKLDSAMDLAHRITVLRRGRVAGHVRPSEVDVRILGELMVGALQSPAAGTDRRSPARQPADTLLAVDNLDVRNDHGHPAVHGANLRVRAGEIVGVAGLLGSGQVELAEAIAGVRASSAGEIVLEGCQVTRLSVRERKQRGLVLIPADRKRDGLVLDMSVSDNLALNRAGTGWRSLGPLPPGRMEDAARKLVDAFDIRVPHVRALARTLSGGNAQKVVLARELSSDPRLVIMTFPTQGLDFSATNFVWDSLRDLRNRGAGILLISADLDELLALSDTLVVMESGRVSGPRPAHSATSEQLGLLMGGVPA